MVRVAIIGLVLIGLAGCSHLGDPEEGAARAQLWLQSQQALAAHDQWDLHARAVVTRPGEVYNIGLQWRRAPDEWLILLEAPFGQGVIRIETGTAGLYRLSLPDGRIFLNHSPEALLEDVIGWSIPVSGLDFWIRAMPRPGANYSKRIDRAGRTRDIAQDDWSIEYLEYFSAAERPSLPRRLRLAHEDLQLRLAIDQWQTEVIEDSQSELFPEFN